MTAIDGRAAQLGPEKLGEPLTDELTVGVLKVKAYYNALLVEIPGAGVYCHAEATVASIVCPALARPGLIHPDLPMDPQIASWTCSACALDWVLRATAIDPNSTRDQVVQQIGYPEHINEQYGLMDGSGSQLRRVYGDYGVATEQAWLGFDEVYALAQKTTGQMSGAAWYHWVALRGTSGDALWIANSAPGYMGVWDTLSRNDFQRLGGFSVVWLA